MTYSREITSSHFKTSSRNGSLSHCHLPSPGSPVILLCPQTIRLQDEPHSYFYQNSARLSVVDAPAVAAVTGNAAPRPNGRGFGRAKHGTYAAQIEG